MNSHARLAGTTAFVLTTILTVWSSQSIAGGSRLLCGNERISEGDTMYQVRLDCGNPISEHKVGESVISSRAMKGGRRIEERRNVTEWVYDKGDFIHTLVFKGSELDKTVSKRR